MTQHDMEAQQESLKRPLVIQQEKRAKTRIWAVVIQECKTQVVGKVKKKGLTNLGEVLQAIGAVKKHPTMARVGSAGS